MYENFAKLLKKHAVTAYRVYKETGVAQSSLSDWKNGKGTPSAENLKKSLIILGLLRTFYWVGFEVLLETK